MFSCVGGFINLILHCRTTARADTATPPRLGFSFCVCSKALPDMQINAITGTNKDVWWEEGRDEERKGGEEGGERRQKGRERAKAILGHSLPSSMPIISWLQSIPHNQYFLSILHFPFDTSSLDCPPSDTSTSAVLLCSSSSVPAPGRTREQGHKVSERRWEADFPPHSPSPAEAPFGSTGVAKQRNANPTGRGEGLSYTLPFLLKSKFLAHVHIIIRYAHMNSRVCAHEEMSRRTDIPPCLQVLLSAHILTLSTICFL